MAELPLDSSLADTEPEAWLYFEVFAKYFRPPSAEAETATRTVTRILCYRTQMDKVTCQSVEYMVLESFDELGIDKDNNALAARVIPWVCSRVHQLLALDLTDGESFLICVECSFCVDQLPRDDHEAVSYVEYSVPVVGGHFDGDGNGDTDPFDFFFDEDEIPFVYWVLDTEKIEKVVTCSICLIDAPIGSELARLPCSHRYHVDCIGSWLERRTNCPYCRFELLSPNL